MFVDGILNGEDMCWWANEDRSEYGFGIGSHTDGTRNGYTEIDCYKSISYPAVNDGELVRFADSVGIDLVFVYHGELAGDKKQDTSGTAYSQWIDPQAGPIGIVEYIGDFRDDDRTGDGKMWCDDGNWVYEGHQTNGNMDGYGHFVRTYGDGEVYEYEGYYENGIPLDENQ
jgi:hypothetical protein